MFCINLEYRCGKSECGVYGRIRSNALGKLIMVLVIYVLGMLVRVDLEYCSELTWNVALNGGILLEVDLEYGLLLYVH